MSEQPQQPRFFVAQASGRLDRVVATGADLARRRAGHVIKAGGVTVDGIVRRVPSDPVEQGARVEVVLTTHAVDQGAEILYENEHLWVLNKPAGLLTEPGRDSAECLTAWLVAGTDRQRPPASHRLDRRASGLVAVAKTPDALRRLNDAFRAGHVDRGYLALVRTWRAPQPQRIREALQVDGGHVYVDPTGAPAESVVAPLGFDEEHGVALVAVKLMSGRQHQARVHLSTAVGAIVGDRRYGDLLDHAPRVALHAGWLGLHPSLGLGDVRCALSPSSDFWSLCKRTLNVPDDWFSQLQRVAGAQT